jgi:hypothetical protein
MALFSGRKEEPESTHDRISSCSLSREETIHSIVVDRLLTDEDDWPPHHASMIAVHVTNPFGTPWVIPFQTERSTAE